jgi:hypothetical protein
MVTLPNQTDGWHIGRRDVGWSERERANQNEQVMENNTDTDLKEIK